MLKISLDDTIEKQLREMKNISVKIGIVGKSDSKLLTYAAVNEYGANIEISEKMRRFLPTIGIFVKKETTHIIIPERSYLRSTFDNKNLQKKIIEAIQKKIPLIFSNEITIENLLGLVGIFYQSEIKKTMLNSDYPENHPATIAKKGKGKKPLFNSGRLQESIGYVVE